jgi:Tfp pilus assembly protein PilN
MIKKDINLFTAYKNGSVKLGGKSSKGPFIIIAAFALVIAATYGILFFMQANMKSSIKVITKELSLPEVVATQNKLNNETKKNELLISYNTALTLAKKNFDASRIINGDLLNKITSSVPATVKMNSIIINTQNIVISCNCTDKLAPAAFTQSLKAKDIFNNITYDGITADEQGNYTFKMTCIFKEA